MPPNEEEEVERCSCKECGCEGEESLLDSMVNGETFLLCRSCRGNCLADCNMCDDQVWSGVLEPLGRFRLCTICYGIASICADCGELVHEDYVRFGADDETYCDNCYDDESRRIQTRHCDVNISQGSLRALQEVPDPLHRLVGLELELVIVDKRRFTENFVGPWGPWGLVTDGSLDELSGRELVSPPLPISAVPKIIRAASRQLFPHCEVDDACGFHVHLDARDIGWQTLDTFLRWAKQYESTIHDLLEESRYDTRLSHLLPRIWTTQHPSQSKLQLLHRIYWENSGPFRGKKDPKRNKAARRTMDALRASCTEKYAGVRYSWINAHSYVFRRTIEVRAHQGTLNPTEITRWAQFWVLMLQGMLAGRTDPPKNILEFFASRPGRIGRRAQLVKQFYY